MEKERLDKIAADKKAEAKQLINNDKALKAFQDQSKKDADTLKKLQEDLFRELNDTNKEAIKEQIENLKEDRRIKDEMEKARLEDIAVKAKERERKLEREREEREREVMQECSFKPHFYDKKRTSSAVMSRTSSNGNLRASAEEIVEKNKAGFAFPSQSIYIEKN